MMTSLASGSARRYFTLVVWDEESSAWLDEFGDYSKKEVKGEKENHSAKAKYKKIIEHDDSSVAMMAARDSLEPPKGFVANVKAKTTGNAWVDSFGGN